MPDANVAFELTHRDAQLLRILARGPYTPIQLLRHLPFPNLDKLWRRLRVLRSAGLVANWPYALMVDRSSYFKLTRQAYRLLFLDEPVPGDAFFNEIKLGSQRHAFATAEFLSLIEQGARATGWLTTDFRRDRDLEIVVNEQSIFPDAYLRLGQNNQAIDVLLEIDCGSEPIRSTKKRESLQRKILQYDKLARQSNVWFRVFFVFSNSSDRLNQFLCLVSELIEQPSTRTPFLATTLGTVQDAENAALGKIFLDHRGKQHSLILTNPGGIRKQHCKSLALAGTV